LQLSASASILKPALASWGITVCGHPGSTFAAVQQNPAAWLGELTIFSMAPALIRKSFIGL
jgi:hypothetical protein